MILTEKNKKVIDRGANDKICLIIDDFNKKTAELSTVYILFYFLLQPLFQLLNLNFLLLHRIPITDSHLTCF